MRLNQSSPIFIPSTGIATNPTINEGYLYYRSINTKSSIALIKLNPDLTVERDYGCIITPSEWYDIGGVEDPRLTKLDGRYYMSYCGLDSNGIGRACLAVSGNHICFMKLGPVNGIGEPNKDAALFPEKINGRYVLLHRYGGINISMAISDDLIHWEDLGPVIRAEEGWIGAGAPPIKYRDGYIINYHRGIFTNEGREYSSGIIFAKVNKDFSISIQCIRDRILFPETNFELKSTYGHKDRLDCVYPCGGYILNDTLTLSYGGADTTCLMAEFDLNNLL